MKRGGLDGHGQLKAIEGFLAGRSGRGKSVQDEEARPSIWNAGLLLVTLFEEGSDGHAL